MICLIRVHHPLNFSLATSLSLFIRLEGSVKSVLGAKPPSWSGVQAIPGPAEPFSESPYRGAQTWSGAPPALNTAAVFLFENDFNSLRVTK